MSEYRASSSNDRALRRPRAAWGGLALALSLNSCVAGQAWQTLPHDRLYQREQAPVLHRIPREFETSDWVDGFYNNGFVQIARLVSPGYYLERHTGGPPALDVNAFGKVPDSVWFENRIGRQTLSAEQVFVGPNEIAGPAPGPLTVVKAKTEGVTPGFFVKDAAGERWLVKLDVPALPEMNSAAEVISTKLLYAAGYHVPENHVARFRPQDLVIAPDAKMVDRYHRKVPFDERELESLLLPIDREPDGRIRAMFSRFVKGRPVGPYFLQGVRADDPNDHIPHERRRSLRGLWVFYAWLNDTDAKPANGLDSFVQVDAQRKLGYLQHYLIDFGTSLGSFADSAKSAGVGYEYTIDWERVGERYLSLGFAYPYWLAVSRSPFRSVGIFESEVFDPARWRPQYPNVDFDSADGLDTFWAAAILAHIGRDQIEAAVRAGEFSEPGASAWVSRVLVERRDKLLRYAFADRVPFDDPEIRERTQLTWLDLERLAGLKEQAGAYEWQLVWRGEHGRFDRHGFVSQPQIQLEEPLEDLERSFHTELTRAPFFDVRLRKATPGNDSRWLRVHLRVCDGGELLAVGLDRD